VKNLTVLLTLACHDRECRGSAAQDKGRQTADKPPKRSAALPKKNLPHRHSIKNRRPELSLPRRQPQHPPEKRKSEPPPSFISTAYRAATPRIHQRPISFVYNGGRLASVWAAHGSFFPAPRDHREPDATPPLPTASPRTNTASRQTDLVFVTLWEPDSARVGKS